MIDDAIIPAGHDQTSTVATLFFILSKERAYNTSRITTVMILAICARVAEP